MTKRYKFNPKTLSATESIEILNLLKQKRETIAELAILDEEIKELKTLLAEEDSEEDSLEY